MNYVIGIVVGLLAGALLALGPFFLLLFLSQALLSRIHVGTGVRFLLLMVKSLRRNLLRTSLTYLATFVLVFVVTMIWSVLYYLDSLTAAKNRDLKVIVAEKWQMRSQMPLAYARPLSEGAANPSRPDDVRPKDAMTWQFYVGALDLTKQTRESIMAMIALEPCKLLTVMSDIWQDISQEDARQRGGLRPEQQRQMEAFVHAMESNKRGVILGVEQLQVIDKRVGDRITLTGINYAGIDLEFEILGVIPGGMFKNSAVMNREYLNDAIAAYPKTHGGAQHPHAAESLNLVWLLVPDQESFNRVAEQIESSSLFRAPAVRCQTLSAEVASVLDVYRDLIWGLRWLLAPSILVTMALVLSGAISISVRERRTELAVLKVLGFRPVQILTLVLGEAVLIGAVGGLLSVGLSYLVINKGLGDFTPSFLFVPTEALVWGPAVGALTGLLGSLVPAWSACSVKVSEVFARTA